jgi:parallel beta-helix repeat protein
VIKLKKSHVKLIITINFFTGLKNVKSRNLKYIIFFLGIIIFCVFNTAFLNHFGVSYNKDKSLIISNDNVEIKNSALIPVAPIIIDNDDPLLNWSVWRDNSIWCSGNGTINDPFVIENIEINGQNRSTCLEIRNSYVYFEIRECRFLNSSVGGYGILIDRIENGLIYDNIISENYVGIRLQGTSGDEIKNNRIETNDILDSRNYGIFISYATRNTLKSNIINNTLSHDGIYITKSYNNNIINCSITNNDQNGLYSVNSLSNKYIKNLVDNNAYFGFNMYLSNNNTFSNNIIKRSGRILSSIGDGIYLNDCDNSTLNNNQIINNRDDGIHIVNSDQNTIIGNNLKDNNDLGIDMQSGDNNTIFLNEFRNN